MSRLLSQEPNFDAAKLEPEVNDEPAITTAPLVAVPGPVITVEESALAYDNHPVVVAVKETPVVTITDKSPVIAVAVETPIIAVAVGATVMVTIMVVILAAVTVPAFVVVIGLGRG